MISSLLLAQKVASAIPGARLVLLEEAGHFFYIERTEDVRREILDFFGIR
jgi:pimeloyl-ACP methyl ester carboxylesterase